MLPSYPAAAGLSVPGDDLLSFPSRGERLVAHPSIILIWVQTHPLSDGFPHPIHALLVGELERAARLIVTLKVSVVMPVSRWAYLRE